MTPFSPKRWLSPFRPSPHTVLAAEFRRMRRAYRRNPILVLICLSIFAHGIYSAMVSQKIITPLAMNTAFDFQFSLIHLAIYLAPLFFVMPAWRRKARSGGFEEILLTLTTRAEIFWSFVLPWLLLILAAIYALYATMWPWPLSSDLDQSEWWWLIWFGEEFRSEFEDLDFWTRLHVLITTLYFITFVFFNVVAAAWLALRRRTAVSAAALYLLITLGLDYLLYSLCCPRVSPGEYGWAIFYEWVGGWPFVLFSLLMLNAHPVVAIVIYPLKWLLVGLMVFDATRRVPISRWASHE